MAHIVYALFAEGEGADEACRELARNCDQHRSFAIRRHDKRPLDGDQLPEAATDTGKNTLVAVVAGVVVFTALGVGAGALRLVPGLDVPMGIGFGLVVGVLSGVLGGTMAGARHPKAALVEMSERLGAGRVLVTVEVGGAAEEDTVRDILSSFEPQDVGAC